MRLQNIALAPNPESSIQNSEVVGQRVTAGNIDRQDRHDENQITYPVYPVHPCLTPVIGEHVDRVFNVGSGACLAGIP